MNNEKTLKSVIDKYKLDDPVPVDVRISMEKSKKENLIRILKANTGQALFTSLVVSFFLWVKKFGISISIAKSAVAVAMALIIGTGVITAAGVYSAVRIADYLSSEKQNTVSSETSETTADDKVQSVSQTNQEITSYAVAVQPIDMDDVTDESLIKYRNKMIQTLCKTKGNNAAVKLEDLDNYHISGKTLSISIIKLDEIDKTNKDENLYRISAKIINSSNSQVLLHSSVTAEGEDRISDSIVTLAEKISSKL